MYDIICKTCEETGNRKSVYTGMTSRSAFERSKEHVEGLNKCHSENALYKHKSDHHLGQEVKFSMKIVRKHYKAISKVVHEAVRNNRQSLSSIVSMNSKSEFSVGNLPRLSIAKKETFEGTNPEPKPNGKVFVFNAGSEKKLKRKRVSTDDFCRNQVKSQSKSKFKDTLFNYFTKPNSAGLT